MRTAVIYEPGNRALHAGGLGLRRQGRQSQQQCGTDQTANYHRGLPNTIVPVLMETGELEVRVP